jgi:hypothetical protein
MYSIKFDDEPIIIILFGDVWQFFLELEEKECGASKPRST